MKNEETGREQESVERTADGAAEADVPDPTTPNTETSSEEEEEEQNLRDLGFGEKVARESRRRLLNRDGSFNVERRGMPRFRTASVYGRLIRIEWWRFYLLVALAYLVINLGFAGAYLLCEPGAVTGLGQGSLAERYLQAFFFSVQTLTTVGYGALSPAGTGANLLATLESFIGLGGFAVVAALFFARMARPNSSVVFSDEAIFAPYGDGTAFEFRFVNRGSDELVQAQAEVVYSHLEVNRDGVTRDFHRLELERRRIAFFPLHWTVVHPIDEASPLYGKGPGDLTREDAEFLVQVTAVDEAHGEAVYARTSYRGEEITWGARYSDIYERSSDGVLGIDVGRIHEIEEIE